MNIQIKTNFLISFLLLSIIASCSLSPGMHMEVNKSNWFSENDYDFVYIESVNQAIKIEPISALIESKNNQDPYYIGIGDQIHITVWGLPEVFPVNNSNSELSSRRVDNNGNIFFPYIGVIKAEGKTKSQLRLDLVNKLSKFFTDPQLDISIVGFNSQKIYILGEVTSPSRVDLNDTPLSLSDALGEVKGLNTNTSDAAKVFIFRQPQDGNLPMIYKADLSSPSGFLDSNNFYLVNNDIIYVNSKGTIRWNRVISQFFPFSTFLNSIDNLSNSN